MASFAGSGSNWRFQVWRWRLRPQGHEISLFGESQRMFRAYRGCRMPALGGGFSTSLSGSQFEENGLVQRAGRDELRSLP